MMNIETKLDAPVEDGEQKQAYEGQRIIITGEIL